MRVQRPQRALSVALIDNRDENTFVRDIQRIEAENLARGADIIGNRELILIELDSNAR